MNYYHEIYTSSDPVKKYKGYEFWILAWKIQRIWILFVSVAVKHCYKINI